MTGQRKVSPRLVLAACLFTGAALLPLPPRPVYGDGAPQAGGAGNTLVLADVMRLVGTDFGTVKREAGRIDTDERAAAQALEATQNAQRYLRVAVRRWAPDRGFQKFAQDALDAWRRTEHAVRSGDPLALKDTLAPLSGTCKACHDVYKRDAE